MGVKRSNNLLTTAAEIRRKAEELLQGISAKLPLPRTNEDTQRLVHELEVHQIELELQNAELCQARNEVKIVLDKYTDLFDFAPIGYFTLSHDGAISAVNLSGADLLGIERSHLLGRRFGLYVADEFRLFFAEFLEKVFAGQVKKSCEVTLVKDGHSPLFAWIEAVALESGLECYVAVIDITERKRVEYALAEKQLKLEELNKTLEVRIRQGVDEMRLKDQAMIQQNSLAAMGDMINNIAHQWRQPLNVVSMVIQSVQLKYDSGTLTSEEMNSDIQYVMESILQMSQTINDFRNFFQPDKVKRGFLIIEAVNRSISLVSASLDSHNFKVEIKTDDDVTAVGYQNEYSQVLLNIISNSCDACIGQSVADPRIFIRITQENERSVLYIRDNCGGIPDDVIHKIFDPYFTTRGTDKGTGIGLYMSKVIIEQNMGGHLTARNVAGGAEFRIDI